MTVVGLVIFSGALVSLLALGWHMRLSGDDYCYNAVLAQEGFWDMQRASYFTVSMYNGNRFSANLLAGFFGLFPIRGSFMAIAASLLAWLGGLAILVRWVASRFVIRLSWLESFLAAAAFANLVLWSAPSLSQSFFWRSGLLSYFSPLVGGTWVLIFVLLRGNGQSHRWLRAALVLAAAIFVGGFSETGAAFWGGFWALFVTSSLIARVLGKWDWIGDLALPAGAALLGTMLAGFLLAISPSTTLRLAESPGTLDLTTLLPLLAWNVRVYLWINLMRRTALTLIPILMGIGLGFGSALSRRGTGDQGIHSVNTWKYLGGLALVGVSMLVLITAVMLPVTLIQSDYPPDRARLLSQAVLTGGGLLGGTLVGVLLHRLLQKKLLKAAVWHKLLRGLSFLLILLGLMAPVQILQIGAETWSFYSRWSQLWDQRHARLEAAGREGVESIHVMALDHVIEDVGELAADPGYWYNNCAEMAYGVDEIVADQPGW